MKPSSPSWSSPSPSGTGCSADLTLEQHIPQAPFTFQEMMCNYDCKLIMETITVMFHFVLSGPKALEVMLWQPWPWS